MKNIKPYERQEMIEQFVIDHIDNLPLELRESAIEVIFASIGSKLKTNIVSQLNYALELFDVDDNPYIDFANYIEKKFGMDRRILEVGGGFYPALSEEISKKQIKIGKGTITVYDPLLCVNKLNHIKLVREEFTPLTHVEEYDLIIGIRPCEATELIIQKASEARIDYMIYPCCCYNKYGESWYNSLKRLCYQYSGRKNVEIDLHYVLGMGMDEIYSVRASKQYIKK